MKSQLHLHNSANADLQFLSQVKNAWVRIIKQIVNLKMLIKMFSSLKLNQSLQKLLSYAVPFQQVEYKRSQNPSNCQVNQVKKWHLKAKNNSNCLKGLCKSSNNTSLHRYSREDKTSNYQKKSNMKHPNLFRRVKFSTNML